MNPITHEQIDAAKTPAGGFTRATLAQWGVPWPPPSGWKVCLVEYGVPFQADMAKAKPAKIQTPITEAGLERMMAASQPQMVDGEPFECIGELDVDPASLLRKVVGSVIAYGHADILWEYPEVLAFFGSRIPQRHEVDDLDCIDERQFEAAEKWPNRKPRSQTQGA